MIGTIEGYEKYADANLVDALLAEESGLDRAFYIGRAQVYATLAVAAATERVAIAQEEANRMEAIMNKAYLGGLVEALNEPTTKEVDVERMVDRFLQWRLPEYFSPDGGISYEYNSLDRPTGTNLLTATQAKEMLEFILG
jgi:hypothetical protein